MLDDLPCKINRNVYDLSDKFDTSILEEIQTISENIHLLVYMNGQNLVIYKTDSNFGLISQQQQNFSIQKHQSKGGSSTNRIARLAEESRDNALKISVEKIVDIALQNNTDQIFVCGLNPWCKNIIEQLLSKSQVAKKVFNQELITETENFNAIKHKFSELITSQRNSSINQQAQIYIAEYK